jgi:NAD+ synthase
MRELLSNHKKIAVKIINFLKREFKKRKKQKAILGISGGLDSTATALLCKKAGLDLYGILLPYRKRGLADSKKVAQILKLPKNRIIYIDIGLVVDAQVKELQKVVKLDKVDKGNIMARQRMIFQYALARRLNGLVVGTEDLSEYYLGYFTLHGDQACDISPIAGLFKTQVYEFAKYLGVPKWVLEKKPSPGLWLGQTAEGELGFTYREADQIIYLSIIKKYPKEKIIKKGFSPKLVNKVLARVKATGYKRQAPPKLLFK